MKTILSRRAAPYSGRDPESLSQLEIARAEGWQDQLSAEVEKGAIESAETSTMKDRRHAIRTH